MAPNGVATSVDTTPVLLPPAHTDLAGVTLSGGVSYANPAQVLSKGSFNIVYGPKGKIFSVQGTGFFPSTVPGSTAKLTVNVYRVGSTFWGTMSFQDTAAGVNISSPIVGGSVVPVDPFGAIGTFTWTPPGKAPTTLTWTVIDNDGDQGD